MRTHSLVVAALAATASLVSSEEAKPRIYFPRHVKRVFVNATITSDEPHPPARQTPFSGTAPASTKRDTSLPDVLGSTSSSSTESKDESSPPVTTVVIASTIVVPPASESTATSKKFGLGPPTLADGSSAGSLATNATKSGSNSDTESKSGTGSTSKSASNLADTTSEGSTSGSSSASDAAGDSTSSRIVLWPTGASTVQPADPIGSFLSSIGSDLSSIVKPTDTASTQDSQTDSAPTRSRNSTDPSSTDSKSTETTPTLTRPTLSRPTLSIPTLSIPTLSIPSGTGSSSATRTASPTGTGTATGTGTGVGKPSSATTPSSSPILSISISIPITNTVIPSSTLIPNPTTNITDGTSPTPTGTGTGVVPTSTRLTSIPTSIPTSVPTSIPTSVPTSIPTGTGIGTTTTNGTETTPPTSINTPPPTTLPPTTSTTVPPPTSTGNGTDINSTTPLPPPSSLSSSSAPPASSNTWLPTTILVQPTSTPVPTGMAPTSTSNSIPTGLPKAITPGNNLTIPDDTTEIQVAFLYGLNWIFVAENPRAAAIVIKNLPKLLAYQGGFDQDKTVVTRLQPYDTTEQLGYVTMLAVCSYPKSLVNQLQLDMHIPTAPIWQNPDQLAYNVSMQINNAISIYLGSTLDWRPTVTGGDGSATSTSGPNDVFNNGDGSGDQTPGQVGMKAGIAVGAIAVSAAYGTAMFIIARRYKRKKQSHHRSSSLTARTTPSEMRSTGSPALMGGALLSRDFTSSYGGVGGGVAGGRDSHGSGRSGGTARTALISAPVAQENSLGWN